MSGLRPPAGYVLDIAYSKSRTLQRQASCIHQSSSRTVGERTATRTSGSLGDRLSISAISEEPFTYLCITWLLGASKSLSGDELQSQCVSAARRPDRSSHGCSWISTSDDPI